MHFVTTQHPKTQRQQQQIEEPKKLTTISTTSPLLTRFNNSSSSSGLKLSRTFATHHFFGNSQVPPLVQKSRLQQQVRHQKITAKLNSMIKDIEISATATTTNPKAAICGSQDNEEEKIQSYSHERRDSVPEDSPLTPSTSKLLTIQELTVESHKNSGNVPALFTTTSAATAQPFVTGLCLKTQRCEVNSSIPTASTTSSPNISPSLARATHSICLVEDSQSQLGSCAELNTADIAVKTSGTSDAVPLLRKSSTGSKGKSAHIATTPTASKISLNSQHSNISIGGGRDEDIQLQVGESTSTAAEAFVRAVTVPDGSSSTSIQLTTSTVNEKLLKGTTRLSERAKKKSWYNVIYPNYKSRAEDFKKLFKDVPNDERLIVDYSCALQRDILVQGRLYVSQNYVCFHANIFSWETYVSIKWKEVTAITKEKTALVIPNAISISTALEKYFFATFTSRDKSFLMLFRVWQNTLLNKQFSPQEIWQYVHNCYGEELGLTTDDEDYIDPTIDTKACDTETDVDFSTAIDDTAISGALTTSDYNTANTNSSQSINHQLQTSGNSSASSGGGGGVRKSKTRSYFFKSNSSANASASGSDNSSRKPNKKMKSNAKELTLCSVKPEEQSVAVSMSNSAPGGSTAIASGSGIEIRSSTAPAFVSPPATIASHDIKRKISKNNRQREEAVSKNIAEAVPTDVSDSSDSEANNIPFVATTECTSPHEGRQILHTILPINIEALFSMLFLKSKFLTDFHAMRKSTDLMQGEWVTNSENEKTRTVNVTVQLAASVGPKTSKVTEYQTMRDCSKAGELYSIDINSVNAGIPYADSFSVLLHYCLARTVDDHTMLSVHAQIKYKKSIWGVVKGFIEKNTWAGLEDFFTSLLHTLQSETCIPPAKGKGRRPRRGTTTQVCAMDDSASGIAHISNDAADFKPMIKHNSTVPMSQVHVGGKQLSPQKNQQLQGLGGADRQNKYRGISLLVVFLMCCLLTLNVVLLLKLWKLEEHIDVGLSRRARLPSIATLRDKPNTNEDWLELLRQQELLHETELRKWHQVLQTAIELLKKVSVVCEKIYNDGTLKQQIANMHTEL